MKKFIILSSQRTGSGYLQESMDSHPDITCYGEILIGYGGSYRKMPPPVLKKHRRLRTLWQALFSGALLMPGKAIRGIFGSEESNSSTAVGFRVMYNQLRRSPIAMRSILKDKDIHVIHLQRRNLLKKYASHLLMHNHMKCGRKAAHVYEKVDVVQVNIAPDKAIRYFRKEERAQRKYTKLFSGHPALHFFYEDIIGQEGIVDSVRFRIQQFLKVNDCKMCSNQIKANPSTLKDFVSNYRELRSRLLKTQWAEFLE